MDAKWIKAPGAFPRDLKLLGLDFVHQILSNRKVQRGIDDEQVRKLSDYNNTHDAPGKRFEIRQCVGLYFDGVSMAEFGNFTLQRTRLVVVDRSLFH